MEEIIGLIVLWFTVIVDSLTAIAIAGAIILGMRLSYNDKLYRTAVAFAAVGLMGQAYRSYIGIATGLAPQDSEMVFWVFKDAALLLFVLHFIFKQRNKI